MKKFLAVILAACVLACGAVLFSACNGTGGDPGDNPGDNPGGETQTFTADVYAPDGAPALALAQLMSENMQFGGTVNYNVVNANTIQTYVTGENPQAELCVLPVNAAAKMLGSGENYKMLGTVTHGNIYILSNTETAELTQDNLGEQLAGKMVGCIQLENFVGFALQIVLDNLGIEYRIAEDEEDVQENIVNIVNIANPASQITGTATYDYMVAAEPVVSTKTGNIPTLEVVGDLQALYGENGYPQAVLVAKADFIAENGTMIEAFIDAVEANASWLLADSTQAETIVNAVSSHLPEGSTPTFTAANLSKTVIENCAVRFESAQSCKAEVLSFLEEITAVNGVTFDVADAFFYGA